MNDGAQEPGENIDNVSQQGNAVEILRQSEEKYKGLFDSMDQGFCIVDVLFDVHKNPFDYRFVEVNPTFEKHSGLKNAVGKTATELVPNLEKHWVEMYGKVATTGESSRVVEGSEAMGRWFEVYAFPIGQTQNYQVAVLFTDVTARKQAEMALKESELRFRALADNSPMFVFIIEADDKAPVSFWNKTWLDYTGQSFHEAVGRAWDGIIHPADLSTVFDHYAPAFANRQSYYIPAVRTKRHDGQYRWYAYKGNPRFAPDGSFDGYVGVGFDVHEQKVTEEKLESLVEERTHQLQRSNEDLQQFAHVASHDLKEPLRKIRTFAHRLDDELEGMVSEQAKLYITKILRASDRLMSMVEGVLAFSNADEITGKSELINLNEIIEDIENDLELVIKQKSAVVQISKLPTIEGAKVLIHQLFYNLINNALKFSKNDVIPSIVISCQVNNGRAIIEVQDNGIGFESKYEQKIFETFQRLNSKDIYEGTGLGLALCKKIVLRHNGTITARGKLGNGATFIVDVPLKQT